MEKKRQQWVKPKMSVLMKGGKNVAEKYLVKGDYCVTGPLASTCYSDCDTGSSPECYDQEERMKKKTAQLKSKNKKWQRPQLKNISKKEIASASGTYPGGCGNCSGGGYAPGPCDSGSGAGG